MKKKGNKKMHTPRQKVILSPHPYIFVMLKTLFGFVMKVLFRQRKEILTCK